MLGRLDDGWVVASETCALDLVGAEFERELGRGELLVDRRGRRRTSAQAVAAADGALCIFEFFYLARPDTRLEGVEVHAARVRMGERLAEEAPVEADLVLPIPDSGTPAAIGFSRATGIPFSEGLIKNRYVGRTFIQPDQELRRPALREVVQVYQEVSAAVINHFEGHIRQSLGDGLLVYFGYPTAHRGRCPADSAGGTGNRGIQKLNTQLKDPVQVRIGIHTGLAVVGEIGGGGKREQLALGISFAVFV